MERNGFYYVVQRYKGHSELDILHNTNLDDVVSGINDIVKRAQERGYHNDEKWLIVSVEWERKWTDDEVFVSSWEKRTAVALYDNGEVKQLGVK